MNPLIVCCLLLAGGSALVLQNVLMVQARAISGSIWAALWLNSVVGLTVLTVMVLSTGGLRPFQRLSDAAHWWFIVPGLLGTLYVLASLQGYARFGAGITISTLVASQLISGLLFDAWRSGQIGWQSILGAVLLAAGAGLVATGRA
ncbi:hypothetical protein P775_28425 [Puniceibacterium antarcticum]|uniref:EamA domain-containing protein n=1 Tax=Puniceibacterium antarcticum TaxID=1206336 RepID=A0A2G8QT13_9RHOB|nr:DMT family transporter [Puniceibacterium antarcticum]PIL12432.1 hypothetical protein P775_28425 [Puniceibacterium antarcticum]